ncbi:MAG TPA: EamA family transporter [Haliangiales bacterium]|nr:EamA family transporter [Haliangiales bacterium]
MTKVLLVLLIALVLEAIGVVYLSRGLKQVGEVEKVTVGEVARVIRRGIVNPSILFGVALETVFFGALLYLLSQRDVSLIWPLTALGFVLTAIAAKFILHEDIHWTRWMGVALIVIGAALVTFSEKMKHKPLGAAPAAMGSSINGE